MSDVVSIPEGLTENQTIEFIREEIIKRGGNPDTAYPVDIEGNTDYNNPIEFKVKFDYQHFEADDTEPSKDISKGIKVDVVDDEYYKYNRPVKEVLQEWTEAVKSMEN